MLDARDKSHAITEETAGVAAATAALLMLGFTQLLGFAR